MIFKGIRQSIEQKRNQNSPVWKTIIYTKDVCHIPIGFLHNTVWIGYAQKIEQWYALHIKKYLLGIRYKKETGKKMVIVIPFRNRKGHLESFVMHMRQFLQGIKYEIVVIEQTEEKLFNRGKLLNVGFDLKKEDGVYFCFHDVDMLPQNIACDYGYPPYPTHLANFCSQFDYKIPYQNFFGGVMLCNKKDFKEVNGFSNEYWGWGCEDDDFFKRITFFKLPFLHTGGRYLSLPHTPNKTAPVFQKNTERLRKECDYAKDGLSNLTYSVIKKEVLTDYTKYTVQI